ncbi:MAG TPA: hypothetical protein PKD10_18520 [Paracoccaceae bacterium]|nr:hypothetical protein [Paracoccaceae bacterium]HMO73275.1 hypothetical protein [Paracoccaceae bacterium]
MFMQDIARLAPAAAVLPGMPLAAGLVADTPVETRRGWQPAGSLRPGDTVQTLDGGLRQVLALDRAWILPALGGEVIDLPGGAFGNDDAVTLLPGQHILADVTPEDAAVGGLPDALAVLIPALAMDGWRGAARRRVPGPVEVVTPLFAEEEYVWAASGLILHCPCIRDGAGAPPAASGCFPRIGDATARRLLAARAADPCALPGWAA